MTRKAHVWAGVTLLVVLALNYVMIGTPLLRRKESLQKRSKMIVVVKNADDGYMLELFRKEITAIDKKIRLINCAGLSLAVIIASWTIFGLLIPRKK